MSAKTGPTRPELEDEAAALERRLEGVALPDPGADEVESLATLAAALRAMDPIPGPHPTFRAQLAARLQLAPVPSSLAPAASTEMSVAAQHAPTMGTGDLVQALDVHLTRLRSGETTLRDALEASPEWAAELEPILNLALGLGEIEVPGPRDEFRRQLRHRLAVAPEPASLRRRRHPAALWRRLWQNSLTMAAISAVAIMLFSTGLVVASANALPREPLYPVKRVVENARLLVAGDEVAMHLHMGYAERRLGEAVIVPPVAGSLLVDFNGQVTAALVKADQAMTDGVMRANIVRPLVGWLTTTRGRLVDARVGLPPTAWRASLALVDAALLALRDGRITAITPVPRLTSADLLLARSRWASVAWRPVPGERVAMAAEGDWLDLIPGKRPTTADGRDPGPERREAPPSAPNDTQLRPTLRRFTPRAPSPSPVEGAPSSGAPVAVEPPQGPPAGSPSPGEGDDPGDRAGPPPATDEPALIPTLAPTPEPPAPTAIATPQPAPTSVPVNVAPVIRERPVCDPRVMVVNNSAGCQVMAQDADGDLLTYEWSVPPIYGQMVPSDDRSHAVYYADFNMSGVTKQIVTITVRVRDSAGHSVEDSTDVVVLTSLEERNHVQRPLE